MANANQGTISSYGLSTASGLSFQQTFVAPGLSNVTSLAAFNDSSANSVALAAIGTGATPNELLVFTRAAGSTIWKPQQVLQQGFNSVQGLTNPQGLLYSSTAGLVVTSAGNGVNNFPGIESFGITNATVPAAYSASFTNMNSLTLNLTGPGYMTLNVKAPSVSTATLSATSSSSSLVVQGTNANSSLTANLGATGNTVNIDSTGASSTTTVTTAAGSVGGNTYNIWGSGAASSILVIDGGGTNSFRIATTQLGGTLGTTASQVTVIGAAGTPADTLYLDHDYNLPTFPFSNVLIPNGSFTAVTSGATVTYQDIAGVSNNGFLVANPGTVPSSIHVGDSLSLTAVAPSGLPNGVSVNYAWDFSGSGQFTDASTQSVSFTWAQLKAFGINTIGTYTIGLRVTASNGAADQIYTPIQVLYTNPTVTVTPSSPDYAKSPVSLTLSATYLSTETVQQYSVNWGDGTVLYYPGGTNPTTVQHTYANAGTYPLLVYVLDDDNAAHPSANYSNPNFTVSNAPTPVVPASAISGSASATAQQSYALTLSVPSGTANEWVINWGDGAGHRDGHAEQSCPPYLRGPGNLQESRPSPSSPAWRKCPRSA